MNIDRRLLGLIGQDRAPFVLSLAASTAASLSLVAQAYLLSRVVAGAFIEKAAPGELLPPIGLFMLFALLRMLLGWFGHTEAKRGSCEVRRRLFERLTLSVARRGPLFTRTVASGRLSTTLLKGVESLDPYFSQYLPQLFLALATPLLILGAVFPADAVSGFILLATAPLIPLFMALIGRRAGAMTDRQWESLSRMSGYFLDMLQGLTTLKLLARSRSRRDAIAEAGEGFRKATMQVLRVAFLSSLTLELVGTIGTAMVAVAIGLRLLSAGLDFRTALFILLLTPDFYLPLRQLGLKFHAGMEGVSASKEIFRVLEGEEPNPHTQEEGTLQAMEPGETDIRFEEVSYSYPGSASPALDGVTCTLPTGSITALVGPSGAGKSTLLNLLLRFQEPDSGTILSGGRPIGGVATEAWRRRVAWVPQHPFLFNDTLRENIMMANRQADEKELRSALRSAGLEELVSSLPEGLETRLGEGGARFSGGEAQRIALARAFIKDAPLVVLDEPTSHTDPELELALNRSMRELMRGRTAVLIAHRLESIRTADAVLVLEGGRVAASGTHRELMETSDFYRRAFASEGEVAS